MESTCVTFVASTSLPIVVSGLGMQIHGAASVVETTDQCAGLNAEVSNANRPVAVLEIGM